MRYEDSPLRQVELRRSLNRPNHIAGAERELVLGTAILTFASVFVALNLIAAFIGIIVWSCVFGLLRMMGKADSQMSRVYIRSRQYRDYYRPCSTPFRRN